MPLTTAGGAHYGKHPEVERGRRPEVERRGIHKWTEAEKLEVQVMETRR